MRHILGLSGGKDSTALAILLHKEIPQMEYFFCDTGRELDETYLYLEKIKARLNIKITYLNPERNFDFWLDMYSGYLPSSQSRWCTRQLKIKPLEKFIGDDETYSYIGIRADENRDGYISSKPNIKPVYPFKERNMGKEDILKILEDSGIGLPDYYQWRSRSGCFFCFFQRKIEWIGLYENHPDLFEKAAQYEQEHKDGRTYTWNQGETLWEILARKDEIVAEFNKRQEVTKKSRPGRSLSEIFEETVEDDGYDLACSICSL